MDIVTAAATAWFQVLSILQPNGEMIHNANPHPFKTREECLVDLHQYYVTAVQHHVPIEAVCFDEDTMNKVFGPKSNT